MSGAFVRFGERLRGNAAVLVLAGAGFLFTMAYGAYLAPEWDPSRNDQRQYIALARGIVDRGEYTRATGAEPFVPEPLRFPGYPLFIAPLCVVGCSPWLIAFTQALLVAALVVVVGKYATTLIGRNGGIIAAGLVALNPSFAFFGAHALSDLFATTLLVASVAVTAMMIPVTARAGGVLAGALFAVAALTRPVLVLAFPLSALVAVLRHGLRRTIVPIALAIVAFIILVAPYVAYVESSFGRPIVGSSGSGLYLPYFQGLDESALDPTEREQETAGRAAIARFDAVRGRAEQARAWIALDDELRARALTLIAHDPLGFAGRFPLRSAILWAGDVPLRPEHITALIAALWRIGDLAWFGLGLLGAIFVVRRSDPLTALPLLVIMLTWATSFPLLAEGRYSLPAQPFLAVGLAALLIRVRRGAPRDLPSRAVFATGSRPLKQ